MRRFWKRRPVALAIHLRTGDLITQGGGFNDVARAGMCKFAADVAAPLPVHSRSFNGSSAASIDVLDAIRSA